MAYYLTRPCAIQPNKTLYYKGFGCWSDRSEYKKLYDSRAELDSMMDNPDGTNGGWRNATVVEE